MPLVFFRIVTVCVFWKKFQLKFMIGKPLPDLLTPSTTFYDVSILCNRFLTPRFPMRQIGAFQPLRRDCARLRHRRMLWLVSKGRAAIFLSEIEDGTSVKPHVLSQFKKSIDRNITNFTILWLWDRLRLFFDFETCDSTDFPASNYARIIAARPFDTIHDILRRLSLAKSGLKVEK